MKYSVIEKLMGKILGKLSWERPFIPRWRVFCRVKESCDFSGSVWTVEARRAVESTDSFFILFPALWNFSFFFFSFFWTRRFNLCFLLFRFLCNIPGYCNDSRGLNYGTIKISWYFGFAIDSFFFLSFLVSQSMEQYPSFEIPRLILKILQSFWIIGNLNNRKYFHFHSLRIR